MQHVALKLSLSWPPLAQRERVHSCHQPLSTSQTAASAPRQNRRLATHLQMLRWGHRSAQHMHSRHTKLTSAAHPQVGLSCPPADSLAWPEPGSHTWQQAPTKKGCCSALHAPELPSPHQNTNTNTPTRDACLANKNRTTACGQHKTNTARYAASLVLAPGPPPTGLQTGTFLQRHL